MRKLSPAIALLALLFPALVWAQALSDRIPGDAMVYIGFTGTDSLGPGFDQSHLKNVLDESQLGPWAHQAIPHAFQLLGLTNPELNMTLANVANIGGPLLRHPTAVYFGGADLTNPNQP